MACLFPTIWNPFIGASLAMIWLGLRWLASWSSTTTNRCISSPRSGGLGSKGEPWMCSTMPPSGWMVLIVLDQRGRRRREERREVGCQVGHIICSRGQYVWVCSDNWLARESKLPVYCYAKTWQRIEMSRLRQEIERVTFHEWGYDTVKGAF